MSNSNSNPIITGARALTRLLQRDERQKTAVLAMQALRARKRPGGLGPVAVSDDVVDVRALRSLTIRDKAKMIYRENLVNMLEPNGRAWMLFTPWHAGDLNAELKQNPKYQQFRRAVGDDLQPVWPEKWPKE